MKKVFLSVALMLSIVASMAQTANTADKVIVRQELTLRGSKVDSIQNDTAFTGRIKSIPTSDAVRRYVQAYAATVTSTGGTYSPTVSPVNSVFARTGDIVASESDYAAFYPKMSTSYFNPGWIAGLTWDKIANRPTTMLGYGITDDNTTIQNIGTPSSTRQGLFYNSTGNFQNFRMIQAGPGITLSSDAQNVTISATGGGTVSSSVNSVFTRTGDVVASESDYAAFYPRMSTSYFNPSWISALTWDKIANRPTTMVGYGITDDNTSINNIGTPSSIRQGLYYNSSGNVQNFRMIKAGTGITLSSDANDVTINATGGGASGVSSFYNRTGAVYPDIGDYSAFYPSMNNYYDNPSWLNSLPWYKISNRPTTLLGFGITDDNTVIQNIGTPSSTRQGLFYNSTGNFQNFRMIQAGSGITLSSDAQNVTISATGGTAGVTSFNGRTGTVTSQDADYNTFYVSLNGLYADPLWMASLSWSKISNKPNTLSGYGIIPAVGDYSAFYPSLTGSYANPTWLTSLPWTKITSRPSTMSGYGITDDNTSINNIGTPSSTRQGLYYNSSGNVQNFRMIKAGNGITLSSDANDVTINAVTPTMAQMFGGSSTNIADGATVWFGGIGMATTPTVARYNSFIVPMAMSVKSVTVHSYIDETATGGNVTFTLYKNEAATSLTLTIAATGANIMNSTQIMSGSVSFTQGDRMELVVTNGSGTTMNVPSWSFAYQN